ncbi:hypothetical protein [Alcanivorax sp.]|uniref:hypothetical protein n=1 Tax=Alcanivorax sp. TaxID=1872427 RepID=UPI003BABD424
MNIRLRSPGQVRFHSDHPAVRGLLMDRACSGDSEQWQRGQNADWPVAAGERLCVRVPVRFDGQPTRIPVTATHAAPQWACRLCDDAPAERGKNSSRVLKVFPVSPFLSL